MKTGNAFLTIGLLLIAAALIFTGYNLWDNSRAAKEAGKAAEQVVRSINPDPVPENGRTRTRGETTTEKAYEDEIEYPDYVLNPNMDMPVTVIDGIEYIGVISIQSLECDLPVAAEWSYANLKTAPCRYSGSVYLNDMVICAHNYECQFGSLKYLSYGDRITFTDMDGNVFLYQVIGMETVDPYAIDEMTSGDWDLTLFTCTIGGGSRVTVRCEKIEEP